MCGLTYIVNKFVSTVNEITTLVENVSGRLMTWQQLKVFYYVNS